MRSHSMQHLSVENTCHLHSPLRMLPRLGGAQNLPSRPSAQLGTAPREQAPGSVTTPSKLPPQQLDRDHKKTCSNIKWHEGAVERRAKEHLLNQKGCCLWFTGLSGSGKSTVACTLEHALLQQGHLTSLLDGDNIRHGLCCNLAFSAEDREENIRRVGEVAKLLVSTGVITIVSCISPYKADRDAVRTRLAPGDFVEIYMEAPLHICEARDPKGLYKLARQGKIKGFTGIDDPYEAPDRPEVLLRSQHSSPAEMARTLLCYLNEHGILSA